MTERGVHSPDCDNAYRFRLHCGEHKGFRYECCCCCDYFWHQPLAMLGAEIAGIGGRMERFGLFEDDPSCQSYYRSPEKPVERERVPVIKNPVPILFWPIDAMAKNEKETNVSLADVWADDVARTIWLGVKPFMLTSQYFRGRCLGVADEIRKRPNRLLEEFVHFSLDDHWLCDGFSTAFWAQLVPHLIWALERQGRWPYFHLPGVEELRWQRVQDKAA